MRFAKNLCINYTSNVRFVKPMQNQLKPMHLTKQHYDVIVIGGGRQDDGAVARLLEGKRFCCLRRIRRLGRS